MSAITIGEVARRAGLRQSAIRYYEEVGLLSPPPRTGGWRTYDEQIVERLQVIHLARLLGLSLDEIRELLSWVSPETPPPERWRQLAMAKLPELDALINRATALRRLFQAGLKCQCVRIEDCFLEDCSKPKART